MTRSERSERPKRSHENKLASWVRAHDRVTHSKLQKLVFYSYCALVGHGKITKRSEHIHFHLGETGPVNQELYEKYAKYGTDFLELGDPFGYIFDSETTGILFDVIKIYGPMLPEMLIRQSVWDVRSVTARVETLHEWASRKFNPTAPFELPEQMTGKGSLAMSGVPVHPEPSFHAAAETVFRLRPVWLDERTNHTLSQMSGWLSELSVCSRTDVVHEASKHLFRLVSERDLTWEGHKAVVQMLKDYIGDRAAPSHVREACVYALSASQYPDDHAYVIEMMNDDDIDVREEAICAVGRMVEKEEISCSVGRKLLRSRSRVEENDGVRELIGDILGCHRHTERCDGDIGGVE